jgi:glucose/arabinose dehydrogenase
LPDPAPPDPAPNAHRYAFAHRHSNAADAFDGVDSPSHPHWKVSPGLDVSVVAKGFTYPINIVFAAPPPNSDDAPWFYVSELHGAVRYVTRSGELHTFAEGLLNFEPVKQVKTDETGISGMTQVPGSKDLLITCSHEDPVSKLLKNRIVRLVSNPDGTALTGSQVVLEMDEFTSPSNQIQQIVVGPDKKLYVAVGDAENARLSLDLDSYGGKLLRLELDGSAPKSNPFYDPKAPTASARNLVFAYGLRNVFDFDFDPIGGAIFAGDNGKDIDRFARIDEGASYHWNGVRESVRLASLYTWTPAIGPVGMTFLRSDSLGSKTRGLGLLAGYGPPGALGANHAKVLLQLELDQSRKQLGALPKVLLQYQGQGRATVLGLAEGPDGVYFTDFFGETKAESSEGLGTVWRLAPSDATQKLARGGGPDPEHTDPIARGKAYFFDFCTSCHRMGGYGGTEGPELTHFGQDAQAELNSKAYGAKLKQLLTATEGFYALQRPRLDAVMQSTGRERVAIWLQHHIEEPRFDNPRAKMPSMNYLAPDVRATIIEYVMSTVP